LSDGFTGMKICLGLGWWRPGVAVGSGAFRDRGPGRTQAGQAVFVLWAESPRV
jgi:hypothetical protein